MKELLLLTCILISLPSCNKPGTGDAGTSIYGVGIHYIDSSGNDLYSLSDDGIKGFWKDSIKIYDITTSKRLLPTCLETGLAYQFLQIEYLEMDICPNTNVVNRSYYTLIHLKKGVDDTIKVKLSGDYVSTDINNVAVWYNGVLGKYTEDGAMKIVK